MLADSRWLEGITLLLQPTCLRGQDKHGPRPQPGLVLAAHEKAETRTCGLEAKRYLQAG